MHHRLFHFTQSMWRRAVFHVTHWGLCRSGVLMEYIELPNTTTDVTWMQLDIPHMHTSTANICLFFPSEVDVYILSVLSSGS